MELVIVIVGAVVFSWLVLLSVLVSFKADFLKTAITYTSQDRHRKDMEAIADDIDALCHRLHDLEGRAKATERRTPWTGRTK